jgi:hypothetical protein
VKLNRKFLLSGKCCRQRVYVNSIFL